jgi:hypothetical protein
MAMGPRMPTQLLVIHRSPAATNFHVISFPGRYIRYGRIVGTASSAQAPASYVFAADPMLFGNRVVK